MIRVVGEDDKKSRQNNERNQHQEKIAESAVMLAEGGGQVQVDDSPKMQEGGGYSPQTFSDAIYTLTENGVSTPSYSVDSVLGGMMQPTEAPQRDAAAQERLRNQAKINLISKGLQAVFGAYVGSQGDVVPGPYDGGMTQAIMQNTQNLDDKYFRQLAEHRDRELKTQLFNMNQEARNNDIRLQKMRDDVKNLTNARRFEEAQKRQDEIDAYQKDQDKKNLSLKWASINKTGGEEPKRGVPEEHKGIFDQEISSKIAALESMKEESLDPKPIQEEIEALKNAPYTFGDKTGLSERIYREALDKVSRSQQQNEQLGAFKTSIMDNIRGGKYATADEAAQDLLSYFYTLNGDEKTAREATQNALKAYGYVGEGEQVLPPKPEDFDSHLDYTAAKIKYDKTAGKRAETAVVQEKMGTLETILSEAIETIGDDELAQRVSGAFKSNPEKAARDVMNKLKKDIPEKAGGYTSPGMAPQIKSNKEVALLSLQKALEDYISHKNEYGKR